MRVSWLWKGGGLLAAIVALGFATGVAWAQGAPITVPMSVTENREPGLTGLATLTPLGNGQYRVEIRMSGLPPNDTARPAHIHTAAGARCDTGAPVTYPLTSVTVDADGDGTSVTTITVTADRPVTANNAYLNVHNPAQMGRGVFCGNITVTLQTAGAAAAPPAAPPAAAAQPAAQRPSTGPAQAAPQAQRPAAPAAAPAARPAAPAAAPVAARPAAAPAAATAQALPRTGTGLSADTTGAWSMAGLAMIAVLLTGTGTLALARRRK
jgi:hypothetical protein